MSGRFGAGCERPCACIELGGVYRGGWLGRGRDRGRSRGLRKIAPARDGRGEVRIALAVVALALVVLPERAYYLLPLFLGIPGLAAWRAPLLVVLLYSHCDLVLSDAIERCDDAGKGNVELHLSNTLSHSPMYPLKTHALSHERCLGLIQRVGAGETRVDTSHMLQPNKGAGQSSAVLAKYMVTNSKLAALAGTSFPSALDHRDRPRKPALGRLGRQVS